MTSKLFRGTALALIASALFPMVANADVIDFDGLASGVAANGDAVAQANGITFGFALFGPSYDEYGDPIAGSDAWRPDTSAPEVLALNPDSFAGGFYGPAPSGLNSLDARDQPVLMSFAAPVNLASFAVTLDNSTLWGGNATPGANDLLFLDADGNLLASLATDQTVAGYVAALTGPLSGVSSILLASGAHYDNITFTAAVPLPAGLPLLLSALGGFGFCQRRRRSTG